MHQAAKASKASSAGRQRWRRGGSLASAAARGTLLGADAAAASATRRAGRPQRGGAPLLSPRRAAAVVAAQARRARDDASGASGRPRGHAGAEAAAAATAASAKRAAARAQVEWERVASRRRDPAEVGVCGEVEADTDATAHELVESGEGIEAPAEMKTLPEWLLGAPAALDTARSHLPSSHPMRRFLSSIAAEALRRALERRQRLDAAAGLIQRVFRSRLASIKAEARRWREAAVAAQRRVRGGIARRKVAAMRRDAAVRTVADLAAARRRAAARQAARAYSSERHGAATAIAAAWRGAVARREFAIERLAARATEQRAGDGDDVRVLSRYRFGVRKTAAIGGTTTGGCAADPAAALTRVVAPNEAALAALLVSPRLIGAGALNSNAGGAGALVTLLSPRSAAGSTAQWSTPSSAAAAPKLQQISQQSGRSAQLLAKRRAARARREAAAAEAQLGAVLDGLAASLEGDTSTSSGGAAAMRYHLPAGSSRKKGDLPHIVPLQPATLRVASTIELPPLQSPLAGMGDDDKGIKVPASAMGSSLPPLPIPKSPQGEQNGTRETETSAGIAAPPRLPPKRPPRKKIKERRLAILRSAAAALEAMHSSASKDSRDRELLL